MWSTVMDLLYAPPRPDRRPHGRPAHPPGPAGPARRNPGGHPHRHQPSAGAGPEQPVPEIPRPGRPPLGQHRRRSPPCGRKRRQTLAAIASAQTAELYGLQILVKGVNEDGDNTTRFLVVTRTDAAAPLPPAPGRRLALLFTVDHKARQAGHRDPPDRRAGFNMENIKSRPLPHVPFEYYFYVQLVCPDRARRPGAGLCCRAWRKSAAPSGCWASLRPARRRKHRSEPGGRPQTPDPILFDRRHPP